MRRSMLTLVMLLGAISLPVTANGQSPEIPNSMESSLLCIDKNLQGNWFLDSAQGIEKRPVHMRIDQDQIYLKAGCNSINSIINARENNQLSFGMFQSTMMGCSDNYETEFSTILFGATSYQRNADRLTFVNTDNTLTFKLVDNASYLSGSWKVSRLNINNGVVSAVNQPVQTIRFDNGQISGSDGCDSYSGKYAITGDNIKFTDLRGTLMFCGGEKQKWANAFGEALRQADKLYVSPGMVDIRNANDELLISLYRN